MTKETFCRNRHIHLGLSMFGHILNDFTEIFQDGTFSQLGISLVSTDLVFSALIR